MKYINTRPPISPAEIGKLTKSLANVKKPTLDGYVLSNMISTCYECGLKNGELIDLSLEDVSQKGQVNNVMKVDGSTISLSGRAKGIIQSQIDYLVNNGYSRYPHKPLFPMKCKRRYSARTLNSHLNRAQDTEIHLEKIRQAGICSHYEELRTQGLAAQDCLTKTKEFARTSFRQVKGILTDNIQLPGKRELTGEDIEIEKEIDSITGSSTEDLQKLERLKGTVWKAKTFDDKLKKALGEWIDNKISSAKDAALRDELNGPEVSDTRSLSEIIAAHEISEVRSDSDVDSAEKIRAFFFGDADK